MKLLVDENLPEAERFFAEFGVLTRVAGRAVTPAQAQAADVLLLRSQTRIDAALLGEAQPRFVGTGTAGVDHVDEAFLAGRGIPFAHAPGCNADPVADWVMVAMKGLTTRGASVWPTKMLAVALMDSAREVPNTRCSAPPMMRMIHFMMPTWYNTAISEAKKMMMGKTLSAKVNPMLSETSPPNKKPIPASP